VDDTVPHAAASKDVINKNANKSRRKHRSCTQHCHST